jgi:hypothetical protein
MPRTTRKTPRYVFAIDTVAVRTSDSPYPTRVHRGEVWHADHPFVVAHPDLFSDTHPTPHPRGWEPAVEQATAAPGELRTTARG